MAASTQQPAWFPRRHPVRRPCRPPSPLAFPAACCRPPSALASSAEAHSQTLCPSLPSPPSIVDSAGRQAAPSAAPPPPWRPLCRRGPRRRWTCRPRWPGRATWRSRGSFSTTLPGRCGAASACPPPPVTVLAACLRLSIAPPPDPKLHANLPPPTTRFLMSKQSCCPSDTHWHHRSLMHPVCPWTHTTHAHTNPTSTHLQLPIPTPPRSSPLLTWRQPGRMPWGTPTR
jgi:hypothetical protein